MRNFKAWTISLIVVVIVMVVCGCACAQAADYGEFYPKLTVVFDVEEITQGLRTIYCVDKGYNIWAFYDDENEWQQGDIANLLMWNINEDEEEHEVVEVYYDGHTDDIDLFMKLNGWE